MSSFFIDRLDKAKASAWAREMNSLDDAGRTDAATRWRAHDIPNVAECYGEVRGAALAAFKMAGGDSVASEKMYPVDVEVGLALYWALGRMGFDPVDGEDDGIWRYLTIKVLPDLTYLRYPKPDKEVMDRGGWINEKRFYSHTRRIWPKTLWWYVHLAWQGDEDSTRDAILGNTSDIISHFIETPGRGYRLDLYRSLMRQYRASDVYGDTKVFNAAMKLNGARCNTLEPSLCEGGVDGYCRRLFEELAGKKEKAGS